MFKLLLNRFRFGERRRSLPSETLNALVEGEQKRRMELATIDDVRKPTAKSPVLVQLVWSGGSQLAPGSVVKLGAAVLDPTTVAHAPFSGLKFHCSAYTGGDSSAPGAITIGPIAGGGTGVGYGYLSEATWALVNVTNAAHTHAAAAASTVLQSGTAGARIVWKPSGTGEKWCVIELSGTTEKFRLIRGQCVGAVGGGDTTFLIDNVIVLSGGVDPSGGNPATQVRVANIFGQSYSDNDLVQAVYSPTVVASPLTDWEQLKTTGTATEKYRAIRGLVYSGATAQATSFIADHIVPWANGLDPVAGNPATQLTIQKPQREALVVGTPFFAVHDGTNWVLAIVERYRMIRGDYYATVDVPAKIIEIDHVVRLASTVDPRSDPLSAVERVRVKVVDGELDFESGDKIYAAYSPGVSAAPVADWESLPKTKPTAASGPFMCTLSGTVSAATASDAAPTTGEVFRILRAGAFDSLGTRTILNPYRIELPATAVGTTIQYTCQKSYEHDPEDETESDDEFTITGIDPLHLLASLDGFAELKALFVPSGGTAASDIKWRGKVCTA